MSSTTTSGLTRRRGAGGGAANGEGGEASRANSSSNVKDNTPETSYESGENGHKIAFDPRDISESAERSKQPKLTLMEEVYLLGLKDKQVRPNCSLLNAQEAMSPKAS
jgi:Golgi phosphoprotein 3